jgi:hypothetical protein
MSMRLHVPPYPRGPRALDQQPNGEHGCIQDATESRTGSGHGGRTLHRYNDIEGHIGSAPQQFSLGKWRRELVY